MSGAASYSVENRLNEVIAAYIEAVDAGKQPNQQDILEQHPDLAAMLKEFFADHERMRRAAVPFQPRNCTEAATLPPSAPKSSDAALAKVRYFGDYELLEEISRGGMGVVYRARQVSLNRIVALKILHPGPMTPAGLHRARRGVEALARLQHPNVVQLFEVGKHDGLVYSIFEYADGGSLRRDDRREPDHDAARPHRVQHRIEVHRRRQSWDSTFAASTEPSGR